MAEVYGEHIPGLSPRPDWMTHREEPPTHTCELCGGTLTIFNRYQDPTHGYWALCQKCYWSRPVPKPTGGAHGS